MKKVFARHKTLSAMALILALFGLYRVYKVVWGASAGETRYVLAQVTRGTIIASVSGSGQVITSQALDIKPKISGEVVYVGGRDGEQVAAGTLIAQIDSTDARKAVRDAQANLESAQLALEKLQKPADALSLTQAQNALANAGDSLKQAQDDSFSTISKTFLDLPGIMTGLKNIIYGNDLSRNQDNISAYSDLLRNYNDNITLFKDATVNAYDSARSAYDTNLEDYKNSSQADSPDKIQSLLNETYAAAKEISDAVKAANDLLNYVNDEQTLYKRPVPAILATHQNTLATYLSEVNAHILDLSNIRNTVVNSGRTIAEKTEALNNLRNGADELDIKSAELGVQKAQNALTDAKNDLANYYVRAPFSGTIGKLPISKFDQVTASTVMATLISTDKQALVSLNEVDAARVKVGQKASLTFDAIEGFKTTGQVIAIDTVGTQSQGVVTYDVKIAFDSQDPRVKSGMSTNVNIITDIHQDVLSVPASTVKSQGENHYVQVFNPPLEGAALGGNQGVATARTPANKNVETGLSNDSLIEIVSGLSEGEEVVVRSVAPNAASVASAPSLFGGGNRPGGGALRAIGR